MHNSDLRQQMEQVEGILQEIERYPDVRQRERVRTLVQTLMDLHVAGLARILELVNATGASATVDAFAADPTVASLLLLHGLHPLGLETRICRALDRVRPYLHSHAGDIRLLSVTDGVIRLAFVGSCVGCPFLRATARVIEDALDEDAPDFASLEIQGLPPPQVGRHSLPMVGQESARGGWHSLPDLGDLGAGQVRLVRLGRRELLLANVAGSFYANAATCPACGHSLQRATLSGGDLICPRCRASFQLCAAGRGAGAWLTPYPLLGERVALPDTE